MKKLAILAVAALAVSSCGTFNKPPPKASIVKPQLERVHKYVKATAAATNDVVEQAKIVEVKYPEDKDVEKVVDLAVIARENAEKTQYEYEKVQERVAVVEEQNIALEDRAFEAERDIGKLKTKLANWRLTAFGAIFAFLLSTTLLVKPWRWI